MIFKDYYKILGLETNKATISQIKVAYREQAKKFHPDVNINNKKYEERFKDINEAYKVLSNSSSKRKYDRIWNHNVGNTSKHTSYAKNSKRKDPLFTEFFHMFFGNIEEYENRKEIRAEKAYKGENVETELNISVEEAFRGKEKSIGVRTVEGKLKKFKVEVPAGIQNNEKIRIVGQGKEGTSGGKNGDLLIRVKIKNDNKFKLIGHDLKANLYLTPWEAALSTKITFAGINEDIQVYIPSGIQSGDTIVIEDRGYKDGKGARGKLILEAKIMIPKALNEKEKKLFKELKEISKFDPRVLV